MIGAVPRRAEISVTLVLRSPFLFQGLNAAAAGVDARVLRDEQDNPIVPADQVKGVLRGACVSLMQATDGVVTAADLEALFGAESPPPAKDSGAAGQEQDRPARGTLVFGDLTACAYKLAAMAADRIAVARARNAAGDPDPQQDWQPGAGPPVGDDETGPT